MNELGMCANCGESTMNAYCQECMVEMWGEPEEFYQELSIEEQEEERQQAIQENLSVCEECKFKRCFDCQVKRELYVLKYVCGKQKGEV